MKKNLFILLWVTIFCISCNFSKGIKTDLKTGLTYSYNGFRIKDVSVLDSYQRPLSSNKLPAGSVLYFTMNNIENYTTVDGKVYFGCSLKVLDTAGNSLLNIDDLYKNSEGVDVTKSHNPIISVRLAEPITAGSVYAVQVHFYDKKNEKNVVDAEIKIEVTPSLVNIEHKEKGLNFEDLWFAEEKGKLPENKVRVGSTAAIFLKGLKGFTEQEGKVYPGCRLLVTDKDGNNMLKYDDLFKNQEGISPEVIYQNFYTTIKFDNPITADEIYDVDIYVFDKKNEENNIQLNMSIEVTK